MRLIALLMVAGALACAPAAASAQAAANSCTAMDTKLPAELVGWTAKSSLTAATKTAGLAGAALAPGKAAQVSLSAAPQVTYANPSGKAVDPASHGGLLGLGIDKAGTYVVAVGSGAWVDLLKDGKPLTSSGHSHGPACSTIHKLVEFPLTPGRYVLQLSGSPDAKTGVLVAKRP